LGGINIEFAETKSLLVQSLPTDQWKNANCCLGDEVHPRGTTRNPRYGIWCDVHVILQLARTVFSDVGDSPQHTPVLHIIGRTFMVL